MRHEDFRSYLLASALTTATLAGCLLSASGAQAQTATAVPVVTPVTLPNIPASTTGTGAQSLAEIEQQLQADLKAIQQEEQLVTQDLQTLEQQGGSPATGSTGSSTGSTATTGATTTSGSTGDGDRLRRHAGYPDDSRAQLHENQRRCQKLHLDSSPPTPCACSGVKALRNTSCYSYPARVIRER